MPEPRANETQKNYIRRCVNYLIENEGKKPNEAAGQCYGMWEHTKKKARRRAHAG